MLLCPAQAAAQSSNVYTVQPGDTLNKIATRLGISVEALAAAIEIANFDVISVGQVLVIPGVPQSLPFAISRPGETLESIAMRRRVPLDQLAALNEMDPAVRLFPGQPVYLAQENWEEPLCFGAVEAIHHSPSIVQGRTGWLEVESRRPIPLTARWRGAPLPLFETQDPESGMVRYNAHLPVPALLEPGPAPLDLLYQARSGVTVTRTLSINVAAGNYYSQQINLPPDRQQLLEAEVVQAELAKVNAVWSRTDTPIQWQEPFWRPIGAAYATTSPYGTRRSYDGGPYSTYHSGQDFGAPVGVPVTAPADGIVALAEPLTVRGNAVILDHGRGVFTGYWHLSDIFVEPGQQVEAGTPLGLVGNTGLSTGAHLHWELRIYGTAVDPLQFLQEPLFPEGGEGVGEARLRLNPQATEQRPLKGAGPIASILSVIHGRGDL